MKYIRTKDGRIVDALEYHSNDKKYHWFTLEEENNTADTIEELCDEFVLVAPYRFRRPKTATELEKDFEEMKYFYTDKDDTIYGAIWTDKGLIYAAKMNEKGELELL